MKKINKVLAGLSLLVLSSSSSALDISVQYDDPVKKGFNSDTEYSSNIPGISTTGEQLRYELENILDALELQIYSEGSIELVIGFSDNALFPKTTFSSFYGESLIETEPKVSLLEGSSTSISIFLPSDVDYLSEEKGVTRLEHVVRDSIVQAMGLNYFYNHNIDDVDLYRHTNSISSSLVYTDSGETISEDDFLNLSNDFINSKISYSGSDYFKTYLSLIGLSSSEGLLDVESRLYVLEEPEPEPEPAPEPENPDEEAPENENSDEETPVVEEPEVVLADNEIYFVPSEEIQLNLFMPLNESSTGKDWGLHAYLLCDLGFCDFDKPSQVIDLETSLYVDEEEQYSNLPSDVILSVSNKMNTEVDDLHLSISYDPFMSIPIKNDFNFKNYCREDQEAGVVECNYSKLLENEMFDLRFEMTAPAGEYDLTVKSSSKSNYVDINGSNNIKKSKLSFADKVDDGTDDNNDSGGGSMFYLLTLISALSFRRLFRKTS